VLCSFERKVEDRLIRERTGILRRFTRKKKQQNKENEK